MICVLQVRDDRPTLMYLAVRQSVSMGTKGSNSLMCSRSVGSSFDLFNKVFSTWGHRHTSQLHKPNKSKFFILKLLSENTCLFGNDYTFISVINIV